MKTSRALLLTVVVYVLGLQLISVDAGLDIMEPCNTTIYPSFDIIKDLRVDKCTEKPCVIEHEHDYKVEIDFVPDIPSDTLKVIIYGEIANVEVPWVGMKTDACKFGDVPCPIVSGTQYTYKYLVHIEKIYPKITLFTSWYFYGGPENKTPMACFKVPLKLA